MTAELQPRKHRRMRCWTWVLVAAVVAVSLAGAAALGVLLALWLG